MNKQSARINHIENIKAMINKCKQTDKIINYKKFYLEIMSILHTTERTAKEYLKVARYELEKK